MNIEESLHLIEAKAALVRYLASSATINPESPDLTVLSGMGDVCGDIEALARAAKAALDPHALSVELKRRR